MSLEPLEPQEALELYLLDRESELSKATQYSHRSRIGHLVRWCGEQEINNLNELTGRRLQEYRLWRREEGNLAPASEKTQMDSIRVFVRWLESMDAVVPDLSTKVLSPSLSPDDDVRDVLIERDEMFEVLGYLSKYQYASLPHVSLFLLWHTMMRVGAAHALDVSDYNPEEQYIEVKHRPETGTAIKNKERGERFVALSDHICSLLDDWLVNKRPEVTDEYGRSPLLTTSQGRVAKSTLRDYCYQYTRPCVYSNECPHGKVINECPATDRDQAARCPSSVSPHAIRRGSITHSLSEDVPYRVVSDRANVSQSVLEKHYDQRSEREKMEQRRKYFEE
ncbi:integrase [Haloferax sp. Atlit-12N]|uniref:tyrosine-type recombinase/integrase n=1 Tax=Haloferax sp. Atlit-12N TaxID=2077203 RepID=UPI000E261DBF|nr:tyrosine-type recombinase/integrase [Haloferax sp. Atlit-12N]RDZ64217.1 integrase [Haloferax sp. Atlit-12N]